MGITDISSRVSILEDPSCSLDFYSVVKRNDFTPGKGLPNMGVSKSCFWIRVDLTNRSSEDHFQFILEHPILDFVELYDSTGLVESIVESGNYFNRNFDDPNYVFDITLPPDSKTSYYLKTGGSELIVIPLSIGSPEKVLSLSMTKEMLFGIYAGIIIVMFIYNFFVYLTVRDRSYLFYVLYILSIGLTQASLKGYTTKYLWPDSYILNHYSVTVLSCLAGMFALEFMNIFLHTRDMVPRLHKTSRIIIGLFGVTLIVSVAVDIRLGFSIMQLITALGSLFALVVSITIMRTGFRPAKFFFLAWSILLVGALIFVLKDFEVLPFNIYTNYSLQVASTLEVVLLSFALADRINIFRKEKEQSQLEALRALEEKEKVISEQNIVLEAKVEERTTELKQANESLNDAMEELKNAQSQLVSAEKMASLGQLTAGIAHEINNPINYVKSSIRPLKNNIDELLELIKRYDENLVHMADGTGKQELQEFREKIQLDYLIDETQDVINNIEEGANRTVEIVSGLRTFSHVDDIGLKAVDVNSGIKSTLKLLSGEIPHELKIELHLDAEREVECYGGKLNQVFMNILNNAIQAVRSKTGGLGKITITTKDETDGMKIIITDDGVGMSDEVKGKIFEPFFTTKDVGEGTGLGLSVVYGIIESHRGSISVGTELGKGSSFVINLPYIQPKE